jgi:hypothetical protein
LSTHLDALERVITDIVAPGATTTDALLDFVGRAIAGLPLLGPAQ